MARGLFHKVGGAQAREAERLGFVKIDRATARRFFEIGKTVIVTGSQVDPHHFTGGYKLAILLDRGGCDGCPELLSGEAPASRALPAGRGSHEEPYVELSSGRWARKRLPPSPHFDRFMAEVDAKMKRSPYGPHVVTFVYRKDFPRLG